MSLYEDSLLVQQDQRDSQDPQDLQDLQDLLHKAPYGRTLQPSPLTQGPARGAHEAYVPRLITSPSS